MKALAWEGLVCYLLSRSHTSLPPLLRAQDESRVFLIWEKAISLLLRQAKFSGNSNHIVPHLSSLAALLQRFGEDKATEGLLGAIGLGKKSCYSLQ